MQHYFCAHPTIIDTNSANDFRHFSSKAKRTRLKRPLCEFRLVCSNSASHVDHLKTGMVACMLGLFSSAWLCCALLSLSPVLGSHLEF